MSSFQDRLAEIFFTNLFRLLSWLPLRILQGLGTLSGLLIWWSRSQNRRVTEINLALCFPHMADAERVALARQSVIESAKTVFEIAAIWIWSPQKSLDLIKRVSGKEYLDALDKQSSGLIVLAPHLGNWELVGLYHAQRGAFTAMYAPAKIPALGRIIYRGRTSNGSTLVPTNASGVKSLLKALKSGHAIGVLPDQVPEEEGGDMAPFFGAPALTMTLVGNLASRTGASVFCCYAKRLPKGKGFELCFRPAAAQLGSGNIHESTLALNQSVERCVEDCPEQYQWEYKRFKKRPGLPRLY
jgi:KDO2-lipid IV(A) lauroyltransferase